MGGALASQRWLGVTRIAAWICILLIALVCGVVTVQSGREEGTPGVVPFLVLAAFTLLPYLTVPIWLRDRRERGLQRAVVIGWAGLIGAGLGGLVSAGGKRAALVLLASQILLLATAYRASAAMQRLTGDQRKLMAKPSEWWVGLLPFLGFFLIITAPGAVRALHRGDTINMDQTPAVAALRTLNTAEVAYAATYHRGYSPTLAALGPAEGAPSSTSAADLIDSSLAGGVKSGYRFTYTPGQPDRDGHIQTYTITARPLEFGRTGQTNYFTDQTGTIRQTPEDRFATAKDPAIEWSN